MRRNTASEPVPRVTVTKPVMPHILVLVYPLNGVEMRPHCEIDAPIALVLLRYAAGSRS